MRLSRVEGLRVEAVGEVWAAYSPLTGRTSLLNDLAAAALEVLQAGPQALSGLCDELGRDSGEAPATVQALVEPILSHLIDAGLLHACPDPDPPPPPLS